MHASSLIAATPLPSYANDPKALPYAVLEHLGAIRVHGKDSAHFLQGQLTQDILGLGNGQVCLAGYCTPKGRLLATFWVMRHDEPETSPDNRPDGQTGAAVPAFWLLCARDIVAAIAKRLAMYVLRAKVQVEDASSRVLLLGFVGQLADALKPLPALPGEVLAGALPDVRLTESTLGLLTTPARHRLAEGCLLARCILVAPPETLAANAAGDGMIRYQLSPNDWQQLAIASGVPWISATTQELFVPQMVNLELAGGVSFRKGCYPGQEVVARSKYLGKQKRRMFVGLCSGQLPLPGTDVLAYDGTPVGLVVQAASLSGMTEAEAAPASGKPADDTSGPGKTPDNPATESPAIACKRYLLLFEARIDAVGGAAPQAAGMIATSLLIDNAAIGLLQMPYPMVEE